MSEHINENKTEEKKAQDTVTYIGVTDFRGRAQKFGIKSDDRTRHTYVIGKTGMGKSTLLENMAIQDIQNGEGMCFIDPHGSTAEKLLKYVPEHRIKDVVYFAPFDNEYPIALNILEHVDESKRHLVASGLMDAFKKVFGEDQFSGRMVYLLLNAILSLLENEGESLMGINRIFADKEYRKKIISNVKDPAVLSFWNDEFAKYTDKYVQEATPAIQNKIGQFISNPMIRNIVGQKKTSFDVREIMDNRKILICNFSIGLTGKDNVDLIGSLLITKIFLAALSRADLPEEELKKSAPFYFYVDEFQNFVNDSFAQILSQARKYNLGLTMAHQYIEQLDDTVRAAVFGNVGTMISFRVGANDAEALEKEFAPTFTADDIVNLAARQICLRLSIDGVGSRPFSAKTLPPILYPEKNFVPVIIASSRAMYGIEKKSAQEEIKAWYQPINPPEKRDLISKDKVTTNSYNNSSTRDNVYNKNESREFKKPFSNTRNNYNRQNVLDIDKANNFRKEDSVSIDYIVNNAENVDIDNNSNNNTDHSIKDIIHTPEVKLYTDTKSNTDINTILDTNKNPHIEIGSIGMQVKDLQKYTQTEESEIKKATTKESRKGYKTNYEHNKSIQNNISHHRPSQNLVKPNNSLRDALSKALDLKIENPKLEINQELATQKRAEKENGGDKGEDNNFRNVQNKEIGNTVTRPNTDKIIRRQNKIENKRPNTIYNEIPKDVLKKIIDIDE